MKSFLVIWLLFALTQSHTLWLPLLWLACSSAHEPIVPPVCCAWWGCR